MQGSETWIITAIVTLLCEWPSLAQLSMYREAFWEGAQASCRAQPQTFYIDILFRVETWTRLLAPWKAGLDIRFYSVLYCLRSIHCFYCMGSITDQWVVPLNELLPLKQAGSRTLAPWVNPLRHAKWRKLARECCVLPHPCMWHVERTRQSWVAEGRLHDGKGTWRWGMLGYGVVLTAGVYASVCKT